MSKIQLYTIGVYESLPDDFFGKLTKNKIDTFCDIRRRRGVRGSEYTFANSKRLQNRLTDLNINYLHIADLSPTREIIQIQHDFDKEGHISQRKRDSLSEKFISAYKKEILRNFDSKAFIKQLESLKAKRVALFCVEKNPSACHRSLAAEFLSRKYGFNVKNL